MKAKRSNTSLFLISILGLFLVIFAAGALTARSWLSSAVAQLGGALEVDAAASDSAEVVHFTVNPGESASTIATRLEEARLIRSALAFRMQARSLSVEGLLAAGEYDLRPNMRPTEILALMGQRKADPGVTVTLLEGWRMDEMADRLDAQGVLSRTLFLSSVRAASYKYDFLSDLAPGRNLEGYLFPDTYTFAKNITGTMVVDSMLRDFDRRFDISMRQQVERSGLTIDQVVTLASIVEREAAVPGERPMIAEVFLNRLALRMLLQADPTVQYAVAQRDIDKARQSGYWKKELTAGDLQIDSPFNTYQHTGLPVGPISNPGLAALKAVVSPTSTGYLYFVAKADGTHAFARTLDDHNSNVSRYRNLTNAR